MGLLFILLVGCKSRYLKFDPDRPDELPKLFAKKVISNNGEHVGYCALSPDGRDLYYAITTDKWYPSKMLKVSAHTLTHKDTMYLVNKNYEGEPFMTKDGKTLYFTVVQPPEQDQIWQSDIYRVIKTTTGWSTPEKLDSVINSEASEWHVSLTSSNVIYFTSEREEKTSALHGDIYRAENKNGKFVNLIKLPYPINTKYNDSDPLIAPDESFLIWHSDRPGGFGQHDLYIAFKSDSGWSNPVNMGDKVNTSEWEMAPALTPDGKYLFFTRRKNLTTTEPAQIFWVSTKILSQYKYER